MEVGESTLPRRPKPLNNFNSPKVSSPLASPTQSISPGTTSREGNGEDVLGMDGTDREQTLGTQLAEASGGYLDSGLKNGTGSSSHLSSGGLYH